MASAALWMTLLPFLGAFLLGIGALARLRGLARWSGPLASATLFLSFVQAARLGSFHLGGGEVAPTAADLGGWIASGGIELPFRLRVDALSAVMALVVTGVSFLIHLYSIGYMAHDAGRVRYFAFLNLFCGFMLLLVTGASLPLLFVGWEGVGLSSYLLIGFWFEDRAKARAGRKAFVVNRIGDAGFLLGMVWIYREFGTLDFAALAEGWAGGTTAPATLEGIALLLFVGCVGKSAQFPLYVWLPDAMAGPTPVSALIHAATMVTAGVYLLGRMSFLYAAAPLASQVVAVTGAFTALLAALMALGQRDIKKVLAFSTVSQLGFMVLAMGVGAYGAGIFHLTTHAYFKALLFLGAGSVIHALAGEQEIHRMGGLKNYAIGTTVTFFFGYLAIIGFPPFSGWFSKDEILHSVYSSGNLVLFGAACLAALLTTVYMTRLFCLVFLGIPRMPKQTLRNVHESPRSMLVPMVVLAVLSFLGGLFPLSFGHALHRIFGRGVPLPEGGISEGTMAFWVTVAVVAVALLTFRAYTTGAARLERARERLKGVQALLERQVRFDDLLTGAGRLGSEAATEAARWFDTFVIDAFVNRIGRTAAGAAGAVARLQSGWVQIYALLIVAGSVAIAWLLLQGAP